MLIIGAQVFYVRENFVEIEEGVITTRPSLNSNCYNVRDTYGRYHLVPTSRLALTKTDAEVILKNAQLQKATKLENEANRLRALAA